ncbi:MAG TPA: S8 family serine peptidase [Terriglobia bacterium]
MYKNWSKALKLIAILLALSSLAVGQTATLSPDLASVASSSSPNVIVRFKNTPTAADFQRILALSQGGVLRKKFHSVKGGAYTVPAAALALIAADSGVAYVSRDREVRGKLDLTAAAINASAAWTAGWDGSGIGVAVIDSGVVASPDLFGPTGNFRVIDAMDFTGGGPLDQYGHGTHVSGIIAASGVGSTCSTCTRTFRGIAPNANLIDLRVLDQNGESEDSTVIQAIDAAIALQAQDNIQVINLSLGRPVFESYTQDPLCQAVEAAWQAGIVVVVAAGNDGRDDSFNSNGYGTIGSPGNDPYVITVGAMKTEGTPQRSDDLIASYSSKGPTAVDQIIKPDIVAPGNLVVSLLAQGTTLPTLYPTSFLSLTTCRPRRQPFRPAFSR